MSDRQAVIAILLYRLIAVHFHPLLPPSTHQISFPISFSLLLIPCAILFFFVFVFRRWLLAWGYYFQILDNRQSRYMYIFPFASMHMPNNATVSQLFVVCGRTVRWTNVAHMLRGIFGARILCKLNDQLEVWNTLNCRVYNIENGGCHDVRRGNL